MAKFFALTTVYRSIIVFNKQHMRTSKCMVKLDTVGNFYYNSGNGATWRRASIIW